MVTSVFEMWGTGRGRWTRRLTRVLSTVGVGDARVTYIAE